jgi:hypothetical protein
MQIRLLLKIPKLMKVRKRRSKALVLAAMMTLTPFQSPLDKVFSQSRT